MVYLFGFFGFVFGFAIGLGLINVLLRHKSMEDIKKDKTAKWKYGLLVWLMSAIGAWAGISVFRFYFY